MTRTRTMAKLLVLGLLAASACTVATASADDVSSASTPQKTPMVETPFIETPAVEVDGFSTPAQAADAQVAPVELPTSASVELSGLVEQDVTTPEATPPVAAAPSVPAVAVLEDVTVEPIQVESVPVQVDLPAGAAVTGTDGHVWTASGLPTSVEAFTGEDGASIDAGPAEVSIGLDR